MIHILAVRVEVLAKASRSGGQIVAVRDNPVHGLNLALAKLGLFSFVNVTPGMTILENHLDHWEVLVTT